MDTESFNLNQIKCGDSILILADGEEKKKLIIFELINYFKNNIERFCIMSKNKKNYENIIDNIFIHDKDDILKKIIDLQSILKDRHNYDKKKIEKTRLCLVLEDEDLCNKYKDNPFFNDLIYNGRCYYITLIIIIKNIEIPQKFVGVINYIFNFDKEFQINKYYSSNLKLYLNVVDEIINNDRCMVIHWNQIYKFKYGKVKHKFSKRQNIFCDLLFN
jgi:hypothetical protein